MTSRMPVKIGEVEALFRYPVKSMRGEPVDASELGWHGLEGDRRLAFRKADDQSGFPWLTATKLPELILFAPQRQRRESVADGNGNLPTHVRTPDGEDLPLFSQELAAEVGRRLGAPVEMMHLNRGIFDEASVSVITLATIAEIGRMTSHEPDARRFRPNVVISTLQSVPFEEDAWVGGTLSFGETDDDDACLGVNNRDERCAMVNLDPDTARPAAEMLKTVVRERDNKAGVYGTVMRRGRLAVGQSVFLEPR